MPTDLLRRESPDQAEAARAIAEALKPLIADTERAGHDMLAYLLGMARIEAEEIVAKQQSSRDR